MKRSALVALVAFTGLSSPGNRTNHTPHTVALVEPVLVAGDAAPLFSLTSMESDEVRLEAVLADNTAVVIKFWATWCPMCWIELFELSEEYETLRAQGIEVLAVAVDLAENVETFLEGQTVECPVLLDETSRIAKQFGVNALPTTVLVDSTGKVIDIHVGLVPDLNKHLARLLSEPLGSGPTGRKSVEN